MKTVGIIGAGPAGICAVRHVMAMPGLTPIAWEHSAQLGGTWLFNPSNGIDKYGFPIHSSMYESLRTNLPREIMGYSDFPFTKGNRSYVKHPIVLEYVNDYAEHFGVKKHIKFEHHVEKVEPISKGSRTTAWSVTVKKLTDGSSSSATCDYIMICIGHHSIPNIPEIRNIEKYSGKTLHSHDYRNAKFLQGLNVAVLGAAFSGHDITFDASLVATNVYLCHNLECPFIVDYPSNVTVKTGIKEATESGFICLDGSHIEVDVLIFCTGYDSSFPFLSPSAKITVENRQVRSLYRQVLNATYPTMAFIGIPHFIIFHTFDYQVRYFLKFCCGSTSVPDEATMTRQIGEMIEEKRSKGFSLCDLPKKMELLWDYFNQLVHEADLDPFPTTIKNITNECVISLFRNLRTFRNTDYTIVAPDTFVTSTHEINSD